MNPRPPQVGPTSSGPVGFFDGWATRDPKDARSLRHKRNAAIYDRIVREYATDGMNGESFGLRCFIENRRRITHEAFIQARNYGLAWHNLKQKSKEVTPH